MQAGQFVTCLALLALLELLRRRRSNWAVDMPPHFAFSHADDLYLERADDRLLVLAGLVLARGEKFAPASLRFVLVISAALIACLEPMLLDLTQLGAHGRVVVGGSRAAHAMARIPLAVVAGRVAVGRPLLHLEAAVRCHANLSRPRAAHLRGVEIWSFGWRGDMTAKIWGLRLRRLLDTVPARDRAAEGLAVPPYSGLIVVASLLSLCCWGDL